MLLVTDGQARHTIPLDQDLLAHGSVVYYPSSDVATFKLRIGSVTESLVATGLDRVVKISPPPPEQPSAQEPVPPRPTNVEATTSSPPTSRPAPPAAELPPPRQVPEQSEAQSALAEPGEQVSLVAAQPIKKVSPQASPDSLKSLVTSVTIHVQVHIDSHGRVVRADSMSHGGTLVESLSNLCVNAAREWLFVPARKRGRPVDSNTVLQFVFDNNGVEVSHN
jgi:hypothetical protein